jgi:RimJ/RimL family protein N-acetyltransferase
MRISLRVLVHSDVEAHNAGEDEQTVRWLTGDYGTVASTTRWFDQLASNARAGSGPRGFGVCLDGRLAGYVDCNPDVRDGLDPGDVNISYTVHPWARGRGLAVEAVRLIRAYIREHEIGARAAIRVDPDNHASIRVAQKSGFTPVRDFTSETDKHSDGTPATLRLYVRDL